MIFDDIKNIKGYVINLDCFFERFKKTKSRLVDLGFTNIHRWVVSNDDPVLTLKQINVNSKSFKNKSEMSCAISHLEILKDFLDSQDDYRLIFEDDIVIHSKFHAHFKKIHDLKFCNYDIFYFGGWMCGYKMGNKRISTIDEVKSNFLEDRFIINGIVYETHAYLVNRNFAQIILDNYTDEFESDKTIDGFYVECVDRRLIKSVLLSTSPLDSDNLSEMKIFNKNNCGLIYQSDEYHSSIQPNRMKEISSSLNKGWLQYAPLIELSFHDKFYNTGHRITHDKYTICESGVLSIDNGITTHHGHTITEDFRIVPDLTWVNRNVYRNEEQRLTLEQHLSEISSTKILSLDQTCLNLMPCWGDCNYYHYLFDFIQKLEILEGLNISISEFDRVIIPQAPFKIHKIICDRLNLRKDQPITLPKHLCYRFNKLTTVSLLGGGLVSRPASQKFIKDIFKVDTPSNYKRIYIKRVTEKRKLENIEEIEELLKQFNFKTIQPELLNNPYPIFNNADIVVGEHGAGLSNCVFCKPTTNIVELIPINHINPHFISISKVNNLQYHALLSPYNIDESMCIGDIRGLRSLLSSIIK